MTGNLSGDTLTISRKAKRIKLRGGDIGIALINENNQGAENGMIYDSSKKMIGQYGFEVDDYSMHIAEDEAQLTYVQAGTLAAALLNAKAVDYVITGCDTGEGAMLACNSFLGVICDHMEDALDAYTLIRINDGNAIAIPFAKGFGRGGDLNLEYIFEKLFCEPSGQGYPRERTVPKQRNERILGDVRKVSFRGDLVEIFKGLDQELVKGTFSGEKFGGLFFEKCKDEKLVAYIRELIGQGTF